MLRYHKVVAVAESFAGLALVLTFFLIMTEDRAIVPDALRKDELRAEFTCRGVLTDVDSDLTSLLARCKEVKLLEKPVVSGYYSDTAEEECNRVEIALHEFTDTISEFQATGVTDRQMRRLLHRLSHWKNRNCALAKVITDSAMVHVQQERDKVFTDLISNLKFLKNSSVESCSSQDRRTTNLAEGLQTGEELAASILDLPNELTGIQAEQPGHPVNIDASPVKVQTGIFDHQSEVAGTFRFRTLELPNPVELLIKGLPVFDVRNAEQAFLFLKQFVIFLKQVRAFQIPDSVVFQILFPHTRGSLTKVITQAIQSGLSVLHFQELVIKEFIPSRLLPGLLTKHYYRTQRSSERFLEFAEDIEIVKDALLLPYSEAEAVRTVGVGAFLPEVRSLFLGLFPPTSWRQLRDLAPNLNDAAAAQQNPIGRVGFDSCDHGSARMSQGIGANSTAPNRAVQNSRPVRQCTWCKKIGHSADRCWTRFGRRTTNRPATFTNQAPNRNNSSNA